MSDIVLTAGVRANLLQLQSTAATITDTQSKLATGKRVNTALDNPINFFTAQGLSNRASDLSNLLDSTSTAINTIQAANNGITSITKLVQSAQALVSQAQQTSDTTVRAGLATQYNAIRGQIDQLAGDSGFNGINLLDSTNSANLTVVLNEKGTSSVTVNAVDFSSAGALAINNASNNFSTTADITAASTPPSTRPTDAPPPAIAPKMPNAFARSGEPANVTVSSPSADGASNAPNAP